MSANFYFATSFVNRRKIREKKQATRNAKQRGVEGGARFEEVREGSEESIIALLTSLRLFAFPLEKAAFTQFVS